MRKSWVLAALLTATAATAATSAFAAKDRFNRSTLGSHWVIPDGSMSIVNDTLQGSSLALGYDTHSSGDTNVNALVTLQSTDLEYGAVASGNIGGGNNAFVKIQAQTSDGNFSNGAFYTGDNGTGDFFSLSSEVPSPAMLSLSLCGTVATMKIKSSAPTQVYNYDYGTTFGTGGGLGTYGSVALDNYRSKPGGGCADYEKGIMIKHGSGAHLRDLSKK